MDTFEKLKLIRGKNGCKGVKKQKRTKESIEIEIEEFYRKTVPIHTLSPPES